MFANSIMKFLNYRVLKTNFELLQEFESKDQKFTIKPNFKREIKKIDSNKYGLILGFEILQKDNTERIPFNLEVFIMGIFELETWEDKDKNDMAINNATAILFPYLRNLVSTVTLNGNVPPYLLPVMNVIELFKQQEENNK